MLTNCPNCESSSLGDQWVGPGRKLQQYCYECSWRGPARVPEQKEIESVKEVMVGRFWGFQYETFDRFGHLMVSSRTYATEQEAEDALKRQLERGSQDKEAGPYTGVLWPATTKVIAKVFVGGT